MATQIISGVQYSGIWNLNSQAGAQAAATWPAPNAYLYSWGVGESGSGGSGSLGINNGTTNFSSPKQVGSLATWSKLSPGSNENEMLLITRSGQMFGVGANGSGQLGDNTSIDRSSPVQIGSATPWAQAACAISAGSAAIKTDGTLWTWGRNNEGGAGQNDAVVRSSPTQVGSLTTWRKVVGGGGDGLVAIKTDGTLWGWGPNGAGLVGDDTTISRSSPVQIGSLTWSDVDYADNNVAAIKTDGSLWVWGANTYGNLGLNLATVAVRSSPVQLGSEYNWTKVAVGNSHMIALKSDGTMWGWGENFGGQLGLNDAIPRSSPVQIGALTSWSKMDSGARFVLAIKEGTLWSMGLNNGRLGTNTAADISSPTQVGSLSTWIDVAGGGVQSFGISSV